MILKRRKRRKHKRRGPAGSRAHHTVFYHMSENIPPKDPETGRWLVYAIKPGGKHVYLIHPDVLEHLKQLIADREDLPAVFWKEVGWEVIGKEALRTIRKVDPPGKGRLLREIDPDPGRRE